MTTEELPSVAPDATLGSIVAARPRLAALFERLGLDYCCGGAQTLSEACEGTDLEVGTLREMITAHEAGEPDADQAEADHDLRALSVAEIIDHIVERHHRPLGRQLRRIDELLAKVVHAHGEVNPDLHRMRRTFARLHAELDDHMRLEEQELFPACRALQHSGGREQLGNGLLSELEHSHDSTGAALARLRRLGNDYGPEDAHCATHRVLLSELGYFEADLHLHIQEENNVLFPQARRLLSTGPATSLKQ